MCRGWGGGGERECGLEGGLEGGEVKGGAAKLDSMVQKPVHSARASTAPRSPCCRSCTHMHIHTHIHTQSHTHTLQVRECTFRPRINRTSAAMMSDRAEALKVLNVSAHEQLFQDAVRRQQKMQVRGLPARCVSLEGPAS